MLCARVFLIHRQSEEKPASFTYFAFKPDLPTVHLHELFRQSQTKAGALRFTGVTARLLKFEEDPFLIFCRDPRTRITHLDAHRSVLRVCLNPHPSAFGRELD